MNVIKEFKRDYYRLRIWLCRLCAKIYVEIVRWAAFFVDKNIRKAQEFMQKLRE